MSRLIFPSAGDRLVYQNNGGSLAAQVGRAITVYSDAAGTVLADVLNFDGSANAAATFITDATSEVPLFQGPANNASTLYVKAAGSSIVTTINARASDMFSPVLEGLFNTSGASRTVTAADRVITATGTASIVFDFASAISNKHITINNWSTAGIITVSSAANAYFFYFGIGTGVTSFTLAPNESVEMHFDGSEWVVDSATKTDLLRGWTTYTPTFTNISSPTGNFAYKIVGKTLYVRYDFTGGTATAAAVSSFSLPSGLTSVAARQAGQGFISSGASMFIPVSSSVVQLNNGAALAAGTPLNTAIGNIVIEVI